MVYLREVVYCCDDKTLPVLRFMVQAGDIDLHDTARPGRLVPLTRHRLPRRFREFIIVGIP